MGRDYPPYLAPRYITCQTKPRTRNNEPGIRMALKQFWAFLKSLEKGYRDRFSHDIVAPIERKKSASYVRWVDHEILRTHWHNFAQIAPGAYRSNHPTRKRFEKYAQMGIKTIVNLRGQNRFAHYAFEVEACHDLNLDLINISLSARKAATRERMLELIDLLTNISPPFLLHCKSGADRTGLASVIYLMLVHDVPVMQAKRQLAIRHMHLNFTQTGILDYIIWLFHERQNHGFIGFRDWVETEYDPLQVSEDFAKLPLLKRVRL